MKVLFCALEYPPSPAGGAEKQAQLQAEELVRRGHTVTVVCQRTAGYRSGVINGVRIHRLPRLDLRPFRTVSYLIVLAGFLTLRMRRFDLVHVHLANLQADVAVAVARGFHRPSYVKVAAGGPLGEIGRLRRVALLTRYYGLRHASTIQAISDEIVRDLTSIGIARDRIRKIPNGVVTHSRQVTSFEREEARQRLNLPSDAFVVLYMGRFERDKGVADLLEAWRTSELARGILLLVGREGVKAPVRMEGLPSGVEPRAWTSDTASYLAAADVFVIPSHAEGMSNALLEAMARGVVSIASRVGAAAEMISHGYSGLLVEPRNIDSLQATLKSLAADPMLRIRMGDAARDAVLEHFGIEMVITSIEAEYRSLTSLS